MFGMTSHIIYLLLLLLYQRLQAFCSVETGLKFHFCFSFALEDAFVEMVYAFIKPSQGCHGGVWK